MNTIRHPSIIQKPEGKVEHNFCKELQKQRFKDITPQNGQLADESYLEQNFRHIINARNHIQLTDDEFQQILNKIHSLKTPYDAGNFLDFGACDIKTAKGKNISINIFKTSQKLRQDKINKDNTTQNESKKQDTQDHDKIFYQYAEQVQRQNIDKRFDVTLLINGLPIAQVELKAPGIDPLYGQYKKSINDSAFEQIKRYQLNNAYNGLFNMLQMFIIMNDENVYYFAPQAKVQDYSTRFVFQWRDKYDHGIESTDQFIHDVLTPQTLLQLTTTYRVLSYQNHSILLPRSYQFYDIKELLNYAQKGEYAYVNNATGSGKTLSACQFAKILALGGRTVILCSDRQALNSNYINTAQSYTKNVQRCACYAISSARNFLQKLNNKKPKIMITTMQTLNQVCKGEYYGKNHYRDQAININHTRYNGTQGHSPLVFIADEIQRSQMSQMKNNIQSVFLNALWYGFTGTPVLPINAVGPRGAKLTTKKMFKHECPTRYSMLDSLVDKVVVPYHLTSKITVHKDQLKLILLKLYTNNKRKQIKIKRLWNSPKGRAKLEAKYANKLLYNNQHNRMNHIKSVCRSIAHSFFQLSNPVINYQLRPMHFKQMLITDNNEDVLNYCEAFKPFAKKYGIHYTGLCSLSDENNPQSNQALESHNTFFKRLSKIINNYKHNIANTGTCVDLKSYAYSVQQKIGKTGSEPYKSRLDFVIVDRQLLTGFNAPKLNTIHIDRPMSSFIDIIQTFSRTNRTYKNKDYGNIIIYRTPDLLKTKADEAYLAYGNKKTLHKVLHQGNYARAKSRAETKFNYFISKYKPSTNLFIAKHQLKYIKQYASTNYGLKVWNSSLFVQDQSDPQIIKDRQLISSMRNKLLSYRSNYIVYSHKLDKKHIAIPKQVMKDIAQSQEAKKVDEWNINSETIYQGIKKLQQLEKQGDTFKQALTKGINIINSPYKKYYQNALKRLNNSQLQQAKHNIKHSMNRKQRYLAFLINISKINIQQLYKNYAKSYLKQSNKSDSDQECKIMSENFSNYYSGESNTTQIPFPNNMVHLIKSSTNLKFNNAYKKCYNTYCTGKQAESYYMRLTKRLA